MIKQLKYDYLPITTGRTNRSYPYEDNNYMDMYNTDYPHQISSLINTVATLRYRTHYVTNVDILNVPATIIDPESGREESSRPSDDSRFIPRTIGPEHNDGDENYVFTGKFKIFRADSEWPYKMIAVSLDYSVVLIGSTRVINGNYEFEDMVLPYPLQMNQFIGFNAARKLNSVFDTYGYIIRVDESDPGNYVVVEYGTSFDVVKFYTSEELKYRWQNNSCGYVDSNGAINPKFTVEPKPEAEYGETEEEYYYNGIVTNWQQFWDQNLIRQYKDIAAFREQILQGKRGYQPS